MRPFPLSIARSARSLPRGAGAVRLLLGAALLLLLLTRVNLRRLGSMVAGADGPLLGAALGAFGAAVVLLEARRFRSILAGWDLGYGAALRITLAGLFVGSFTPGAVGAEVYKIYATRRPQQGTVRLVVRVMLLRVIGAAALVVVAGGALLAGAGGGAGLLGRIEWRRTLSTTAILAIGAAALAGLALIVVALRWTRFAPRLREAWRQGREALAELRGRLLGELVILSLAIALLRALSLDLLARSLGATARFEDLAVVAAFSVLAGVIPLSPAGLGVQEGVVAGCLVLLGVPLSSAVAVALLNRCFLWLFAAAGIWALATARPAPPPDLDSGKGDLARERLELLDDRVDHLVDGRVVHAGPQREAE